MADVAQLQIEISTIGVEAAQAGIKAVGEAGAKTEDRVVSLSSAIKGLASSLIAMKSAEVGKEVALLGARYEMLGATMTIMGNNMGHTRAEMDQYQVSLEQTGISMLRARGAMQVMAAAQLDVKNAAQVARVAQDAATLAGVNSSEAFNNLVRGMATGEVRIIRHMGIMVNFKEAYKRYADQIGVTVGALNEHQRAEARMQEVIEQGAKRYGVYEAAMTTAGKQLLSMERYTENLKVQLGETLNPATNAFVFELVEGLKRASEAMKEWQKSGGQAIFATQIAGYVRTAIDVIESLGTTISKNIGIFKAAALVYASVKVSGYVEYVRQMIAAEQARMVMGQAVLMNEKMNVIALAQAKLTEATATQAVVDAEVASHGTRFKTNALLAQQAAATRAVTAAKAELAVAEKGLEVASGNAARAASAGGRIIAALGGPIGIAILAIGALIAAWQHFRSTAVDDAEAATRAMQAEIDRRIAQTERERQIMRIRNSNISEEEKKRRTAAVESGTNGLVANLEAEIANANRLLKKYTDDKGRLINPGLSDLGLNLSELKEKRDAMEATLTTFKRMDEYGRSVDAKYEADNMRRAKLTQSTDEREDKSSTRAAEDEILRLKALINEEENKGRGYSRETLEILKAREERDRRIAEINVAIAAAQKSGHTNSIPYLQQQIGLQNQLLASKEAAITRTKEQDALDARNKAKADETAALANVIVELELKESRLGKTERQLFVAREMANAVTKEEIALAEKQIAKYDKLTKQIETQTEYIKLQNEAKRLNERKDVEDQALEHLKALKEAGLVQSVYTKMWAEIQMKGNTAMSALVNGMKITSDKMAEAFTNFALTGKLAFKDLVSSILADLAKLMMQKAFMQLLEFGLDMLANSGTKATYISGDSMSGIPTGSGNTGGSGYVEPGVARASGGPVEAGREYVVGERGPERFRPGVSGTIIPNGVGGGSIVMNNYVTIMSDGSAKKSSDGMSDKKGKELGDSLFAAMDQWAIMQMRPNGLLDMRGATR